MKNYKLFNFNYLENADSLISFLPLEQWCWPENKIMYLHLEYWGHVEPQESRVSNSLQVSTGLPSNIQL